MKVYCCVKAWKPIVLTFACDTFVEKIFFAPRVACLFWSWKMENYRIWLPKYDHFCAVLNCAHSISSTSRTGCRHQPLCAKPTLKSRFVTNAVLSKRWHHVKRFFQINAVPNEAGHACMMSRLLSLGQQLFGPKTMRQKVNGAHCINSEQPEMILWFRTIYNTCLPGYHHSRQCFYCKTDLLMEWLLYCNDDTLKAVFDKTTYSIPRKSLLETLHLFIKCIYLDVVLAMCKYLVWTNNIGHHIKHFDNKC